MASDIMDNISWVNGIAPDTPQTITWFNVDLSPFETQWTNFCDLFTQLNIFIMENA